MTSQPENTESILEDPVVRQLHSEIRMACRPHKRAKRQMIRQLLVESLAKIDAGLVACESTSCGVRWCREDELTPVWLPSGVERRYCPLCLDRHNGLGLKTDDVGSGKVYLVSNWDDGLVKIGRTSLLIERRMYDLRSQLKTHNLKVVWIIRVRDSDKLERQLHQLFAAKRVFKEWFRLTQEDVELVTSGRYQAALGQGGALSK